MAGKKKMGERTLPFEISPTISYKLFMSDGLGSHSELPLLLFLSDCM